MANQQRNKKEDCLTSRLRRTVRFVLDKENTITSSIWSKLLTGKHQEFFLKIIRSLGLLLCLTLFLLQMYDRMCFYYTYPVTTDVFINYNRYQMYPDITICYSATHGTSKLNEELNFFGKKCSSVVMNTILATRKPINVAEIWKRINSSESLFYAKETSSSENLTQLHVALPYGTCTTFRQRFKNKVRSDQGKLQIVFSFKDIMCTKRSASMTFMHEAEEYPMSRQEHELRTGVLNKMRISLKKYSFVNTTRNPCVSSHDYSRCVHECFKHYAVKNGNCRIPFEPEHTDQPICNYSNHIHMHWHGLREYLLGRKIDNCTCTRKCYHSVFDDINEARESYTNQSVHEVEFRSPYETNIKERLVYTTVHVLEDLGGNSGLWIGMSLLSFFSVISPVMQRKKAKVSLRLNDPFLRIVRKVIRKDPRILKFNQKEVNFVKRPSSNIKKLMYTACVCFLSFGVCNRATHFFTYPVRNLIEISFNQTIDPPSITICPGDQNLNDLRRQLAIINNVSNFCDVQTWQLLGLPNTNVLNLWASNNSSAKNIRWRKSAPVYLHEGTCFDLDDGKRSIVPKNKWWVRSVLKPICGTNYQKVYIRPPTGYYDYFFYRYITSRSKVQIMYTIKEISTNVELQACVNEITHEACKFSCLQEKLWQQVSCRLPYMPSGYLPLCNSLDSARLSHQVYLKLFIMPGSSDNCKCLPPCIKRIYQTVIYAEENSIPVLGLSFGASHNVIETYKIVRAYTLVSFLCDVGALLGSTLGLCALGFIDRILTYAKNKHRSFSQ